MAALTIQTVNRPGIVTTYAAAGAGGDTFANSGKEILQLKNDDAGPKVATIATTQTVDGGSLSVQNLTVTTVPAGGIVTVGPLVITTYSQTVSITYDDVTSLSVAVLKVS